MTEPAPDRKHTILDAACRVIAQAGAARLRVADVAREAGVSTALVHYYFPGRADVIEQAFAHADDLADAVADAKLQAIRTGRGTGREAVRHVGGRRPGDPRELGGLERDVAVLGPQRRRPRARRDLAPALAGADPRPDRRGRRGRLDPGRASTRGRRRAGWPPASTSGAARCCSACGRRATCTATSSRRPRASWARPRSRRGRAA